MYMCTSHRGSRSEGRRPFDLVLLRNSYAWHTGSCWSVQALCEHFRILGQQPPATVLANLHPTFWWGVLMTLFGAFYTIRFRPKRKTFMT